MVGFTAALLNWPRRERLFRGTQRAAVDHLSRQRRAYSARVLVQDEREGGGRIIGEVCHFIDLMQFWTRAPTVRVYAEA